MSSKACEGCGCDPCDCDWGLYDQQNAGVAQLVERHVANVNAVGSSPITCSSQKLLLPSYPPTPTGHDKERIK